MVSRTFVLIALVLAVVSMGRAQDRFAEVGVGGYGTGSPRITGHASLILGIDDKNFSFTTAEFRGVSQQPTYAIRTGYARKVAIAGPVSGFLLLNAGVSNSPTATTGSGAFGGAVQWKSLLVSGQMLLDPNTGGKQSLVTVGYVFRFKNE